jgi:hypothetical protein
VRYLALSAKKNDDQMVVVFLCCGGCVVYPGHRPALLRIQTERGGWSVTRGEARIVRGWADGPSGLYVALQEEAA